MTTKERDARVDDLETRLANLERQFIATSPAPTSGKGIVGRVEKPDPRANAEPRWLNAVRYGGQLCPGGCHTVIQVGARGWYEPKITTSRGTVPAQVFCVPCGEEREKALTP